MKLNPKKIEKEILIKYKTLALRNKLCKYKTLDSLDYDKLLKKIEGYKQTNNFYAASFYKFEDIIRVCKINVENRPENDVDSLLYKHACSLLVYQAMRKYCFDLVDLQCSVNYKQEFELAKFKIEDMERKLNYSGMIKNLMDAYKESKISVDLNSNLEQEKEL